MKLFFLSLIFIQSIFSFSQVFAKEVLPTKGIEKRRETPTLVLSKKKNTKQVFNTTSTQTVWSKSTQSAEKVTINFDQYKNITRKKQDWKLQLKNLTNDVDSLEEAIQSSKDETAKEAYAKQLYELKYYRSIVNANLKNYGKAVLEAREVVKFDESYLLRKPSMFFNKNVTLNDAISAQWSLLKILEEYSCKGGVECITEVMSRYNIKWYEGEHDYTKYESVFFNNSNFADIKTVVESFMGKSSCVGKCLIGQNIEIALSASSEKYTNISAVGAASDIDVCNVYTGSNQYSLYSSQIITMNSKILQSTSTEKVKAYLCRGFTNIMMLESGINTNAGYIANAKNDIKSAIAVNSTLPFAQQVDEIDDIINIDALFQKCGELSTKGMTNEDKALAQYSISQQGLNELKTSLNTHYTELEDVSEVSQYLTEAQKADIATAYGNNSIADPNGDEKVQTAKLTNKTTRATAQQGLDSETNLQDFLDAILDLQKNGDL